MLFHCRQATNRSPTLVIALLMYVDSPRFPPRDIVPALHHARKLWRSMRAATDADSPSLCPEGDHELAAAASSRTLAGNESRRAVVDGLV